MIRLSLTIAVALLYVVPTTVWEQEKLVPRESWDCFFAKQRISLHYDFADPGESLSRIDWVVSIREQVVAQSAARVVSEKGRPNHFVIPLEIPAIEPGIVLPISVVFRVDGVPVQRRQLWGFSHDAFAGQQEKLKEMKIVLFDPVKTTAPVFEKETIPFSAIHNIDELALFQEGTLIIGEGVSFRDYRSLPDLMVQAAARGAHVICLAPAGGSIVLPGTENSTLPQPSGLSLGRNDVIEQFDKRLDSAAWPKGGLITASSIRLAGDRRGVTGVVIKESGGWPWVEATYANSGGRMVICGFAIVKKWDLTPTPRYLMLHLLQNVKKARQDKENMNSRSTTKGLPQ